MFVFDVNGVITEVNKTAAEKLQYNKNELLGQSRNILYPAERKEDVEKCLLENLSGKRSYCPLPFITKSGGFIYVETKLSKGEWNGSESIFSVSIDVTEKKLAEDAARRIEERYQILFGNINDAVFVHEYTQEGIPGKFLEVNDIACKRLGYSREELLKMTPKDIDAPEGYAKVPSAMKKLVMEKHTLWEGIHVTKTGVRIPVEISNHLFSMEGKSVILATVRDISERKKTEELLRRSEEKYRKIFENVQDIFYQADIEGRIIEISPSIERYSGYKPEELIGIKIEDVYLDPADRGNLLKMLSAKGEVEDYIIKLRTKDSRGVFVSANIHILFDQDGKPSGVEGSLRDVSERLIVEEKIKASEKLLRKQNEELIILNEEIRIAKEKAEESDRLKSAFLANMSHEIRTPMNGIIGFSEMLANPKLSQDVRDSYVKIVSSSCDQLLHIVNDIIDISRIEAGQIDLSDSALDLNELLREIFSFYLPIAQNKGIELVFDTYSNKEGSLHIISDRTKMKQVLDHLLSNAVKFTHSGKITLKYILIDEFIQFEVDDTGIGILPELQNAIFERFRQVETSFTKQYGGTGLGLSITKAYVEKMGGSIWVSSELGKGSAFFFTLPYKAVIAEDVKEVKPVSNNHVMKSNMTLLVVEDEDINWFYLYEILKSKVKTLRAENGKQAIELIKNHSEIGMVLMDIKLPDINGLELTGIIKSINTRIKVIAQTAFALPGDREKALEAGCSDYITKPVKREDLLNLISIHSDNL